MIDEFLLFFEKGISGKIEPFEFSIKLEDFIADQYDGMYKENPHLTDYLSEVIPDITEPMELGMNPTNFYNELKNVKKKILEML